MKIERSIDIAAPADTVWRVAHEPSSRAKWDVRVAEYAIQGPLETGTPIRIGWRAPVVSSVAEGRIIRLEEPALAAFAVDGATLPIFPAGTITWQLSPASGGTRFTSRFEAHDAEYAGPSWLIGFLIKRDLKRSLENLQRLVGETGAVQPAAQAAG
jgi:uncharacterized protein YndB with AHSA1/START domain